jgi:hypothetical protein
MAVDLVFRYGPTQLFAVSGSDEVGDRQLRFKSEAVQVSQFIGGTRSLISLSGRFSFLPIQQATNLTPSGKGWDYPLEGQGFSSGSSHQLFPKLKR